MVYVCVWGGVFIHRTSHSSHKSTLIGIRSGADHVVPAIIGCLGVHYLPQSIRRQHIC